MLSKGSTNRRWSGTANLHDVALGLDSGAENFPSTTKESSRIQRLIALPEQILPFAGVYWLQYHAPRRSAVAHPGPATGHGGDAARGWANAEL